VLAAFVVGREQAELSAASLRQWLGEKLPDYMIPSRFVVLESLPLTPSGKVDRKALEKLEGLELGSGTDYVAPRNELERALVEIWQAVLRREQVGIQDNFFALGGHSLLAVRLAAEIDKILGHKLPIASLFQAPTIELLAQRLTDENWAPAWSALVPLQPEGSQPPLFFVHGWGGDVYSYLGLSRLLPPDQPSYGIQAVGLDGKSARHITVEDMAANYVKEIVSFQPEGPFYLAGYSMGGVIAFEVAQQLQRLGRRVALLALLDSGPTGATPWVFYGLSQVSYLRNRCRFHLRHWWELPWSVRLSYLRGRWASLRYYLDRNRSKPPSVTAPPQKDSQPPQVPGFGDYYYAVASAYRFRPYPGSADVFVSDDANPGWRWYWRYLARGGVSFHQVPGRHFELITPDYTPALAKSLTAVLHRAQAEARATQSRRRPTHADLVS